jgi:integrase
LLGLVAAGGDPAATKTALKAAPTAEALAARFLFEHVDTNRKPVTAKEYRRLVDNIILPALGRKRVPEVTRADVVRLHHARRATPIQANRVLAVLSTMFTFAERLGEALAAWKGSPYAAAAIKLLVFTGAKLGVILGLRWEWVDMERGEARLPDSKTGAKTVNLPPPALEVLAGLPRLEGVPYVLGAKRGTTFVEEPWRRIRSAVGLDDVRLHDLRHSFASIAAAA